MLEKFPRLILYKGASSVIGFDFSQFDFMGGKVVLTIKDMDKHTIKTVEYNESRLYNTLFDDDWATQLEIGRDKYLYDLMLHIDNERYPQCLPSPITVLDTVGCLCHEE